jgi:uncharacterized glyoxalase superfamily protein PhnB
MTNLSPARVSHLAPVLVVDRVEPCVAFWVDRFGFTPQHQIPGEDGSIFFASVAKDGIEIMYQTRASVEADPVTTPNRVDGVATVLYFTVPNLDDVERATVGAPIVKPRHQTPYGSSEIYIREPGGHLVGFAQF